jgi:hypothetical protein
MRAAARPGIRGARPIVTAVSDCLVTVAASWRRVNPTVCNTARSVPHGTRCRRVRGQVPGT